ncbi:MAG TPA: hypothetical protein VEC36_07610 [Patescibacteria group bacterium]|nr:hypothetical protein [Patescibacteria group bacterium]
MFIEIHTFKMSMHEMSETQEVLLYEEPWLKISFNMQRAFVRAVWSGFPKGAQFRAMTKRVADEIRAKNEEFPGTNSIFDISRLLMMSYDDMDWAAGEGDMLLYNAGARKLGFLVLDSQFDKFYMDAYQYQAQRRAENKLQRCIFKTEAEALQWLSE